MKSDNNRNVSRRTFIQSTAVGVVGLGAGATLSCVDSKKNAGAKDMVKLEILEPRGVLVSTEVTGLSNPRVSDLNGKRIALLSEKPEADLFFNAIEKLLKEAYPDVIILRFPSPVNPTVADNTDEVAKACDVWMEGIKTSTSSEYDYDVKLEKLGKPGVGLCVESLLPQRKSLAEINGMPTLRMVSLPTVEFFSAKASQEMMNDVAAVAFDETVRALTVPLTEAEKNPVPIYYDYSPKKFTGKNYAEANENFQQYCCDNLLSDGLPVVPPTKEAVDEMLTGTSRLPSEEIGIMYPHLGMATIEKIAISSVMAGAKPEYLPVIIAAIECITERDFVQYHIVTGPVPIIWISGPIVEEIGLNNGIGYLSPGYRANSSIGRAVAMCMINIGWRRMDIYAMPGGPGTPVSYTNYLVPENQKQSPWESFSVERGYCPEASTVSVDETLWLDNGPGETLSMASFEQSMEQMAGFFAPLFLFGISSPTGNRYQIAMHPTMAAQLAKADYTKQSFVQWLYDKNAVIWDKMNKEEQKAFKESVERGEHPGIRPEDCKSGMKIEPFTDPKHVTVLVAGDAAGTTLIWGTIAGSTSRRADSPSDFVERPCMTKVIGGATLTKAGRG